MEAEEVTCNKMKHEMGEMGQNKTETIRSRYRSVLKE